MIWFRHVLLRRARTPASNQRFSSIKLPTACEVCAFRPVTFSPFSVLQHLTRHHADDFWRIINRLQFDEMLGLAAPHFSNFLLFESVEDVCAEDILRLKAPNIDTPTLIVGFASDDTLQQKYDCFDSCCDGSLLLVPQQLSSPICFSLNLVALASQISTSAPNSHLTIVPRQRTAVDNISNLYLHMSVTVEKFQL